MAEPTQAQIRENQIAWVEALRSGVYKQGKGVLHDQTVDEWCCLGVGANVLGADCGTQVRLIGGPFGERSVSNSLEGIGRALGLTWELQGELMQMNDISSLSFDDIADFLEATFRLADGTVGVTDAT